MINLLPPEQIKKIRLLSLEYWSNGVLALMVMAAAVMLGYLLFLNFSLRRELGDAGKEAERAAVEKRVDDLERFEQEVQKNHDYIKRAKNLEQEEEKALLWSAALQELAGFTRSDVELQEFVTDEGLTEVKIAGMAGSRESVLALENGLKGSDFYQEVIAPVSNLTARENVEFEFNLKLKNEEPDKK